MKIAVVTGASSGIGRVFVKQIVHLYKDLDEIWVVARRKDRLLELQKEVMLPLRLFDCDLRSEASFRRIEDALSRLQPDIRMLVNAAGFGKIGKVTDLKAPEQLHMIDINCKALTHMIFSSLPNCSKGTRIINVASAAAFCPQPSFAVYAATKSYVLSFSRAIREELREKGIFVTAVCPGPVDTEFFDIAGTVGSKLKTGVMVKPEKVVKQAILDAIKGKSMSVYGFTMKSANAAAKILPHGVILKALKHLW